jgi:hypothetical protein
MKELTDDMLDEVLADSPGQYFFHRDDTGKIELVFETGIVKVEPGEEDLVDRVWNPRLTDADGNPLLDFQGNPRQPWTKFEAKGTVDGLPVVHSFGGQRGSLLREFIKAMKKQGLSNKDLPGTKWTIEKIGQWDWDIHYVGKGEIPSSTPTEETKPDNKIENIKKALSIKKDQVSGPLAKNSIIEYLALVTQQKFDDISNGIWSELIKLNVIKENEDGTVTIL